MIGARREGEMFLGFVGFLVFFGIEEYWSEYVEEPDGNGVSKNFWSECDMTPTENSVRATGSARV